MKKHYLIFGSVYCIMALLVFAAAISFYTKKKIDEVNEFAGYSVINSSGIYRSTLEDPRQIISRTLYSWEFAVYQINEEGFYSSVIDTENGFSVLLETEDLVKVRYYGEVEREIISDTPDSYEEQVTQLVPGDERYMFFTEPLTLTEDEEFALRLPLDVTVTGASCDDIFVYGGSLSFPSNEGTRTVDIATPAAANEDESVPYEDWIVRLDAMEYYPLGADSAVDREAHVLSDEFVERFKNSEESPDLQINRGVFTTTASAVLVYDGGRYLVTYYSVMHPLEMVLKQNLIFYIPALLALILVEVIIIFSVRKLYLNRKDFELRSRKLTSDIAKDLKAPLAATKAHMETWEKLGEEERQEYSEKIISEVDHMSGMVTKLLELSKTNIRDIKLNKEAVDLLLLTRNIKDRAQGEILGKDIEFTILHDEEADHYSVLADLELMQIAINSFVSNAVKYCDKEIRVKLTHTGRSVTFAITNDGTRVDDTDKVWDSNAGLSVAKSILEAHRARYSCYYSPKGTTFSFTMDAYDEGFEHEK
ncbi:MAG TPA: hypothetical protein DCW41_07485 [Clostridiales bacterium]|nr:hypothetical protein [Clostridiales bacterium]